MWFYVILWMQAGFHPATVRVSFIRLLNLTFCQCHWPYHHTHKKKKSWPCKRKKTLTAVTLFYIQGCTRGWWVGLSSPDIQTLLLNWHLSFQRSRGEKKDQWVCKLDLDMSICRDKLWVQIWNISQKHLWSHLAANSIWLCMCTEQEASLSWQRGCGEMVRKNSSALVCGKSVPEGFIKTI